MAALAEIEKGLVLVTGPTGSGKSTTLAAIIDAINRNHERHIDAFPADEQEQVRISLSESLTAVVSQLLLPTADGKGRIAVHEILLRTTGLSNLIREGNTVQIHSLIQSGKGLGMQLMDDALFALVKEGKILPLDAYRKALDKSRFEPMLGDAATTAA